MLTAGKDKTIKLWSLEGKKVDLLANYRGHSDDVSGVCLLLKNKLVVSVGEDKMIKIWAFYEQSNARVDIRSAINTVLAHDKCINTVRASPCEKYLATCSHDRTVKIWDLDLKLLFNLAGHRKGVWDIAFHEIELILVSAAGDGMIKGWSLLTGECLWSMG